MFVGKAQPGLSHALRVVSPLQGHRVPRHLISSRGPSFPGGARGVLSRSALDGGEMAGA